MRADANYPAFMQWNEDLLALTSFCGGVVKFNQNTDIH